MGFVALPSEWLRFAVRPAGRYNDNGMRQNSNDSMKVDGRRTAVVALALWSLVIAAFMLLNRALDLEVFFVLVLIGLLVMVELIDTSSVQSGHLRRAKYVVAVGVLVFGWVVMNKVVEILAR
jgi:hypothetical protein